MTESFSALDLLRRSDKLSLGGGRMVIWAPEFPLWADRPGFWDHAAFLEHKLEPLFIVTLLDESGREIPLALQARGWTPARLSQNYLSRRSGPDPIALPAPAISTTAALRVEEDRCLTPEDVLLSSLSITNLRDVPQTIHLILWTAQPRGSEKDGPWIDDPRIAGGRIAFTRRARGGGVVADSSVAFLLGADRAPDSWSISHSEWSTGRINHPRWELTPFYEQALIPGPSPKGGRESDSPLPVGPWPPKRSGVGEGPGVRGLGVRVLPCTSKPLGGPYANAENTLLYMALAYPLELAEAETATIAFACALAPEIEEAEEGFRAALGPPSPGPFPLKGGRGEDSPFPEGKPRSLRSRAVAGAGGLGPSESHWISFFSSAPEFHCSDPFIETYYYYRLFGLRLNAVDTHGRFNLPRPAIFEGINSGWFRHQISYSAQAHMREARWLHAPALAQGALENFIANQRPDGSFVGGIMTGPGAKVGDDFMYHADWGAGVHRLYALHPSREWLSRICPALVRYADYYKREHDRENSGLYDVRNQAETGQEYMARYLFADPQADRWGPLRLKGVDATVYAYNLNRALEWMAAELGRDPAPFKAEAAAIGAALLRRMWDDGTGFFFDVHPVTGRRSASKAATGFYPFLTDLPGPGHLRAFEHLFNPDEFWTPCPVPATSLDDPTFNAFGEWKERRTNCPWNGRAWLMTTSHVAQALAQTAIRFGSGAGEGLSSPIRPDTHERADLPVRAAELIRRYIHSLFLDGDLARPTSYEYYNPLTGAAPFFRGTDDYMHSWIADLILQFVAGIQPDESPILTVHPLPFGLVEFSVERVRVKGREVAVRWREGEGLRVEVDGRQAAHRPDLGPLSVALQ